MLWRGLKVFKSRVHLWKAIHYMVCQCGMVKMSSGKWWMCIDYTNLNKVCTKDMYPLLSIDRLVDGAANHMILTFLYAYYGYNQISIPPRDKIETIFMTTDSNFCYEVISFNLKNVGATYQRLMDKVFKGLMAETSNCI